MNAFLTTLAVLLLIAAGAYLIHRLNAEHAERIAVHRYSRALPTGPRHGTGTGPARSRGSTRTVPTPTGDSRRGHLDGGRGRFPARRRRDRTTHHG
ncbi:hypothetical protein ACWC10_32415 [Streptomyces sp. NPDC001595]|uniref:hypothetical protein n=1 Tax=Streptomyces sp. NPDC001532 TaxID=3154520 RepID=UPI00332312B1